MAEIINLRMARKAKARSEAEKLAAGNRAKFGQTKAEKKLRKLEEARAAKAHAAGALEAPEIEKPATENAGQPPAKPD